MSDTPTPNLPAGFNLENPVIPDIPEPKPEPTPPAGFNLESNPTQTLTEKANKDYLINPEPFGPLESGLTKSQAGAITAAFPTAAATIGGLLGEGWASIPGAMLGGAAGKALQQLTDRYLGIGKPPESSLQATKEMGLESVEQGALQAAGMGVAKVAGAAAKPLVKSAGETIGKVFAPTKAADKAIVQKAIPRLLEEKPIALTRESLEKQLGNSARAAGNALDTALENIPPGTKLSTESVQGIVDSLNNEAKRLTTTDIHGNVKPIPGTSGIIGFYNDAAKFVENIEPSFENVRKIRQTLDTLVDQNGKWNLTGAEGSIREIQRDLANNLRTSLAQTGGKAFQQANKDYSFYKGLQTVIEHTNERQTGQVGHLTRRILTGAGAVVGAPGGLGGVVTGAETMNLLSRAVDSTAWRTVSAAMKSKIADYLAADQLEIVAPILARIVDYSAKGNTQPEKTQPEKSEASPPVKAETPKTMPARPAGALAEVHDASGKLMGHTLPADEKHPKPYYVPLQ